MTEATPLAAAVSGWGRYRKKPVVVEAWQLVGTNAETHAVYQWIEANTQGSFDPLTEEIPASGVSIDPATGSFLIATLEGVMQAKPGDWVIRGVQGEFYPIKDSIFRETYEPAGHHYHIISTDGWCHTTAHYSPHVKVDTPDPRLHVLARRLPDWPTDDLADLLAELDEAVTL